ncbi:MAG TPA: glycosyltransferase family A protein [Rhizomicrobium sp.]|jgi:glycosyltransferase involved in cell wall biosynthesis
MSAPGQLSPPIAVVSFNRPHYLALVLDSLLAQTALHGRQVFLFQDNAVSAISEIRYASDDEIATCVESFRARFPDGRVFLSPHNLGVSANILRAEEFLFSDLGSETAYFLEDDMVLSPHYLDMMDRIATYVAHTERVGYFAAYGHLTLPLAQQRQHAARMGRLSYNWAFGLTRKHWRELREWLDPFYRISDGFDYPAVPRRDIAAHYRALGLPLVGATQDIVKKMGTYALGRVAINTVAVFGRNIGETGFHFDPEKFRRDGFGATELYPEPVHLEFPTASELDRLHAEEMESCWAHYNAYLAGKTRHASKRLPRLKAAWKRLLHPYP